MTELQSGSAAAANLSRWLVTNVEGWGGSPVQIERLSGGSSASIYRIQADDRRAVLRTSQTPARPDSLRALAREARVLGALAETTVPHPRLLAHCAEEAVIGAPFLVTRFVDGWSGAAPIPDRLANAETERALALSLMDALAELHQLDYRTLGLAGFGRPDGFLGRQVDQWSTLFAQHRQDSQRPSRHLPDVPVIAEWLRNAAPGDSAAALIHCDASFSNVMFCGDPPPRVAALIDWEIATIGDPLLDIGRAIYPFPDERGVSGVSMMIDHSGGPTRQALAKHYAERLGIAIEHIDYYMVLAMFKLAALIEPNYARHAMGLDPSGFSAKVADFVPVLLHGARSIVDLQRRLPGERIA